MRTTIRHTKAREATQAGSAAPAAIRPQQSRGWGSSDADASWTPAASSNPVTNDRFIPHTMDAWHGCLAQRRYGGVLAPCSARPSTTCDFVALSGVAAWLHARARSRSALAAWDAILGLAALGALFLGVVLAG